MRFLYKFKKSLRCKNTLWWTIAVLLFIYVFSVPSFGESSGFIRYIIYFSMALLGISVFGYCFLYGDFKISKISLLVPGFCIFSLAGTLSYSHEFRSWFTLVLLALSFYIFVFAFKIIKDKYTIIVIITSAFFLFSLYYIFYYRKQIIDYRSYMNSSFRLGWFFDNPNGVSAYAVVGVAAPLYLFLFFNKKIRFIFIIPILTMFIVGLTTGSRTFLLIIFLMILIFFFFKFKSHKLIYFGVVVGLIGLGILLLNLPFLTTVKERLVQAIQSIFGVANKIDTSTLQRVVMIDYGFYLGSKRMILGYGVNGFASVSGIGTYAHSNFAEVVCDFGLIGFLLFYSPLIVLFVKSLTSKKIDKSFTITFVFYYLVVSFSNVIYYKKIYYLVLAFLLYLVFIEPFNKTTKILISDLKHVVFTCDSMGTGGAEKVIALLANQMSKQGITVTIYGIADLKLANSFYHLDNVKYINIADGSGKRINSLKRIVLIRKKILSLKPDIVLSFLPNANIYTWLSLIGTNIPYIVSERNNPFIDPKNKLERVLKIISFKMSSGAVFQTEESRDYYSNDIRNKSIIIKNPILLCNYSGSKTTTRNKVVLAVGRLNEQKNYKCLLKSFSIFNQQKSNEYVLRIYGDGPLKNDLVEYCKELEISDCVIFTGNDANWHSKEQSDAMYVLSSDYEGMPNALAEAMALGIPSISTDCPSGGPRELIRNGENGYLVPVNNPEALALKMIELSNRPAEMFAQQNSNMIDEYSAENITNKWITFIMSLTKEIYE